MHRLRRRRRWLWLVGATTPALAALGAAIGWLVGQGEENVLDFMALGATVGGGIGLLTAPIWNHVVTESLGPVAPPSLDAETRSRWEDSLRAAVMDRRARGEASQLGLMVQAGQMNMGLRDVDTEVRSKIRVGGKTQSWADIFDEWDRGLGRLVILGDPGYGKTVAALTLLDHINTAEQPGGPVAELFPLVEWQRWSEMHGGHLGEWLVYQLVTSYGVSAAFAHEHIASGRVLPIFDGLDEVPTDHRTACKDAIDRYAESARPARGFVLTCRAIEYGQLAPEWVSADRQVLLVGLDAEQIVTEIRKRTTGRPGWDVIADRIGTGDAQLTALFRSPLRLSIAFQAYRRADPRGLIGRQQHDAQAELWDRLLELDAPMFRGRGPAEIRSWLQFLATGMERWKRQRFWMHELHLIEAAMIDEESDTFAASLSVMLATAIVAISIVRYGFDPWALLYLLGALVAYGWLVRQFETRSPAVGRPISWSDRFGAARDALHESNLHVLATWGVLTGAFSGSTLLGRIGAAAALGVFSILAWLILAMARAGSSEVHGEPPTRLLGRGPDVVLKEGRNRAILQGIAVGFAATVIAAVVAMLLGEQVYLALPIGLAVATAVIGYELLPWFYHYWLRWRLARKGLFAPRAPVFLAWCAEPQRGWLRVSDAYEFRHRELLDHLAGFGSEQAPKLDDEHLREIHRRYRHKAW